jgi:hypothetical protein
MLLGMPVLYVVTEAVGVWSRMVPFCGSTTSIPLALERLASLQPAVLGIPTLAAALVLYGVAMLAALVTAYRSVICML